MSIQGHRPGLHSDINSELNGDGEAVKPSSRLYIASQATAGIGPVMRDFEVVTFYPKSGKIFNFSQVKVTSPKGKFKAGGIYRIYFELVTDAD